MVEAGVGLRQIFAWVEVAEEGDEGEHEEGVEDVDWPFIFHEVIVAVVDCELEDAVECA